MKTTQLENMKRAAEVLAAFGDSASVSQVKKYMNLTSAIKKIENTSQKEVISAVLDAYRDVFNQVPRDIRGIAKSQFCAAINEVLSENGTLFVFDMSGNVVARRALAKVDRKRNTDLWALLGNLFSAAELAAAQERAENAKKQAALDAYLEAMNDELHEYSIAQLVAA